MEYFRRNEQERELSRLRWLSEQQHGRMAVVTGSPGSGLSTTVREVLRGFKVLAFRVGGKIPSLQMEEFIRQTEDLLGGDYDFTASTPSGLIEKIADYAKDININVIIYNFEELGRYWKDDYVALDALWRRKKNKTKMFLALCSFSASAMDRLWKNETSPLFNTPDSEVVFPPLKIAELKQIFGFSSPDSTLLAWSMTDGLAGPVSLLKNAGVSDVSGLAEAYFSSDSPLVHWFKSSLDRLFGREGDVYLSILQVLSSGVSSQKDIEGILGMNVGGHLSKLETGYDLIVRERPAFAPPASRGVVRYRIKSIALEFWIKFVWTNINAFSSKDYPRLSALLSKELPAWLDSAQVRYFHRKIQEETQWQNIGSWWSKTASMDIVAWNDGKKRIFLASSCRRPEDFDEEKFKASVNAFKIQSGKAGGLQAVYFTRNDI